MLGNLFRRTSTQASGVPHPAVAGMRVETERDARGFQIGVILPRQASEASIAVSVADAATLTPESVSAWHDELTADKTVTSTCASATFHGAQATAVLWATFAATNKAERKDSSEFLTRLARSAPEIYDCADRNGMDAHPLSPDEIIRWVGAGLTGRDDNAEFPPRARTISEGPAALLVNGQVTVSFEVDSYGSENDVLSAVTEIGRDLSIGTDGEVKVRVGAWLRPAEDDAVRPRRVGVVSLTAAHSETVEDAALILIRDLSARQRLHIRRLWHRQSVGAGSSLGTGVIGWQRLEVAA